MVTFLVAVGYLIREVQPQTANALEGINDRCCPFLQARSDTGQRQVLRRFSKDFLYALISGLGVSPAQSVVNCMDAHRKLSAALSMAA
jgi:hypothetical protein